MNKDSIHRTRHADTGISINSLAELIANRITAIKVLHAERGENPASEIARQFSLMAHRTKLRSGHVTTQDMEYLSAVLIPEAMMRLAS
jgi:hypothetical protein